MLMLQPTLRYDFELITLMSGGLERYSAISAETLLLGGGNSPSYLRTAVRTLEDIIPNAHRVELAAANHGATGNKNRRGEPARVAEVLRPFLLNSQRSPAQPSGTGAVRTL
jgi:hypothetical protein